MESSKFRKPKEGIHCNPAPRAVELRNLENCKCDLELDFMWNSSASGSKRRSPPKVATQGVDFHSDLSRPQFRPGSAEVSLSRAWSVARELALLGSLSVIIHTALRSHSPRAEAAGATRPINLTMAGKTDERARKQPSPGTQAARTDRHGG